MERHANKTNVLETIKISPQPTTKTGRTVFAYLRRSTKKSEQADSLLQQSEWVHYIAKIYWISECDIIYFIESRSGFENRTRKEWNRMIEEIDKLKEPCTILCRDTSRLSRNPKDNLAIADRIFCDNDFKKKGQKIWRIYFLEWDLMIKEWNKNSWKSIIVDTLHKNYMDSLETKDKSWTGHKLKLEAKELPFTPPHWITRVIKTGEQYRKNLYSWQPTSLKQNERMPFIKRVFQMKVELKTAKELSKYLKQYWNIHITEGKIVETIIQNTVYRWYYTTNKKTEEKQEKELLFWEWKPPIEKSLWDSANATIWKRGNGYGDKQADHIARGKIKYEDGNPLYLYTTKKPSWKKYRAYGTEINTNGWERKTVNIMESKIVERFINDSIPKIIEIYFNLYKNKRNEIESIMNVEFGWFIASNDTKEKDDIQYIKLEEEIKKLEEEQEKKALIMSLYWDWFNTKTLEELSFQELLELSVKQSQKYQESNEKELLEHRKKVFMRQHSIGFSELELTFNKGFYEYWKKCWELYGFDVKDFLDTMKELDLGRIKAMDYSRNRLTLAIKESSHLDINAEEDRKLENIKELQKRKSNLLEEKFWVSKKYAKLGYSVDVANAEIEDMEKEIQSIDKEIEEFWEITDYERYLERLPEILNKIHELVSRVLSQEDYESFRKDLVQLIDITAHELILNKKKELKIELNDPLNKLFFCLE